MKGYRVILLVEDMESGNPVSLKTQRVMHVVDSPRLKIIESVEEPVAFAETMSDYLASQLQAPIDEALAHLYHELGVMLNAKLLEKK